MNVFINIDVTENVYYPKTNNTFPKPQIEILYEYIYFFYRFFSLGTLQLLQIPTASLWFSAYKNPFFVVAKLTVNVFNFSLSLSFSLSLYLSLSLVSEWVSILFLLNAD